MPNKTVSVAVRCRAVLPHDRDQRVCVRTVGDKEIECLDPEHLHSELREKHGRHDYLKENHCRERAYTFDAVFGPASTNVDLFEQLALPLVPEVLSGKHATCFAYGQTGSGKTHTMLGRQGESGLVERTLRKLLEDAAAETTVSVSFVEVYNEKIRDLLQPECLVLDLRDDRDRGPCIAGVREVPAKTADAVMQLVKEGNNRRTEETTAANPVSSRSHAVLQFTVETQLSARKTRMAKLSLIDLAGSERAANTGNRGARLREGAMINKSLLALANCITALTRKGAYVNYRDSKLTRLLKDSLSGNCYTMMVAHVSPSIAAFEETLNTLKYAHRACEIRGLGGGVRENVVDRAAKYADRLQPCLDATSGLRRRVTQLLVPKPSPEPRRPSKKVIENAAPNQGHPPAVVPAAVTSRVVALADELEKTRKRVINQMRARTRIEQTAMELDDQNEANAIELSKIEIDAIVNGTVAPPALPKQAPNSQDARATDEAKKAEGHLKLLKKHGALRAATRKNHAQRKRVEQQSAIAEKAMGKVESEAKFVSLLTDARAVIDGELGDKSDGGSRLPNDSVEKRLLQAQHAISLLEVEKVEAEQAKIMLEAAARQHELALRKQSLKMDVQVRALMVAQQLLAKVGLVQEWHKELGPLAKFVPSHAPTPGLDELIAELSAPTSPVGSPQTAGVNVPAGSGSDGGGDGAAESPRGAEDQLKVIDEGFNEMRQTLRRTVTLATPSDEPAPSDDGDLEDEETFNLTGVGEDEDEGDDDDASASGVAPARNNAAVGSAGGASSANGVSGASGDAGNRKRSRDAVANAGYGPTSNTGNVNWATDAVAAAADPDKSVAGAALIPPWPASLSLAASLPAGSADVGWGPASVGVQPTPPAVSSSSMPTPARVTPLPPRSPPLQKPASPPKRDGADQGTGRGS